MTEPRIDPVPTTADDPSAQTLFPSRLPRAVAASTGTLIVALFAVVVAASVLVRFPESIRCPFVLVPAGGADPVRAPREGTVTQILVAETQEVRKGQDLFVVRSQEIRNWTSELRTLQQDVAAADQRVALLERDRRADVAIQSSKVQQFERDLAFQQEYLKTLRDFLVRYERLDADGLVPPVDMMAQRLSVSKAERDVAMTRQSRDTAALEIGRIENEYGSKLEELQLGKRKAGVRVATLDKLLENSQEDVVRVAAPFDGTVVSVARRNAGEVVTSGQELCRIARSDSSLIAEIEPPEQGLPRLAVGQRVQLLYQAYPYERFGAGLGAVRWISPAAVASPGGERFVAHVALDSPALGAPSAGRLLRAGMRGEARVVVGRRTLVDYVLEPLRKLRETVGARP
jgi:multidrug efflux pump subunit AcrA (membrane-fusion protein)